MTTFVEIGPRCAQNPQRIKNCKRKDLEKAISVLISRYNHIRKENIASLKLTPKEKESLFKISHIKKSEHTLLQALFQKISWKEKTVNFDEEEIYPALVTLEKESDLSSSAVNLAKKELKEKGLILWRNRYSGYDGDHRVKSKSNIYEITTRTLDLAEFTELSLLRVKSPSHRERIKELIHKLLTPVKTVDTLHQKSGKIGFIKKQTKEAQLTELEEIKNFFKETYSERQKEHLKRFENLIEEIKTLQKHESVSRKKSLRVFQDKNSGSRKKRCNLQKEEENLQKLEEQAPDSGDKYPLMNPPKRIPPMNTPPPAQAGANNLTEIFQKYTNTFKRRVSPREQKLFSQNFSLSRLAKNEVLELLNEFGRDKYLKETTRSINRIFDAERIFSLTEEVKARLRKEDYTPKIIEPLGPIHTMSQIFPKVVNILAWAHNMSLEEFERKEGYI